ncbi:MAG TPA: Fic family protein [Bryobacteraceae bacterium]|nr:Fic family protein [Bryobacteraceae bacterium]
MAVAYKWHPITDLPGDPKALTDGELEALQRVWIKQKGDLTDPGTLEEFNKRLRREWAIETGILEKVYTFDRGVTRTLIEKGIDAAFIPRGAADRDSMVVARIIQDHYDTLEGLFDFVGGTRQLSTSYIKELHAALLRNQETYAVVDQFGAAFERRLEKGQYKTESNSPLRPDGSVHEYCPPEHVAAEMDRLAAMHAEHEGREVPPEVEAAWLHHRFTQIHPFADGNGRVARAISTLVFINAGWFPLIVKREDWGRYVGALEKADQDDLRGVVAIFVEAQRNALIQATEAAYESRAPASIGDAVAAVRDKLIQRGALIPKEWVNAKNTARVLSQYASSRLEAIAGQMSQEISSLGKAKFTHKVSAAPTEGESRKLLEITGHSALPEEYSSVEQLWLEAGKSDRLMIWFRALGPRFRAIIGVVAYLSMAGKDPELLEGGTFQINYEEDSARAQERFAAWLDRMIVTGLNKWRATL